MNALGFNTSYLTELLHATQVSIRYSNFPIQSFVPKFCATATHRPEARRLCLDSEILPNVNTEVNFA